MAKISPRNRAQLHLNCHFYEDLGHYLLHTAGLVLELRLTQKPPVFTINHEQNGPMLIEQEAIVSRTWFFAWKESSLENGTSSQVKSVAY